MKTLLLVLLTLLVSMAHGGIVLEDAEDGTTDGWRQNNGDPACQFENIYDAESYSRVIRFNGGGSCVLGSHWAGGSHSLHISDGATVISWRIRTTGQPFNFYVVASTSDGGYRFFNYASASYNHGLHHFNRYYIHHGLAQDHQVNTWRRFTRDLSRDLHDAQPDVDIIEIHGIIFNNGQGSLLDDIVLYTPDEALLEDGESGTDGWGLLNNPPGSSINNIPDNDMQGRHLQGHVISLEETNGQGIGNGYRLGAPTGPDAWRQRGKSILQWRFRQFGGPPVHPIDTGHVEDPDALEFRVSVQTVMGQRDLVYRLGGQHLGITENGQAIHHAIGDDRTIGSTIDEPNIPDDEENPLGLWQAEARDLQQDIRDFEPRNRLLSVNAFTVRNAGLVDDIKLLPHISESYRTVFEDAENENTNGWWVYDDDPPGAGIANLYDADRQSRVIETSGDGLNNGYEIGRRHAPGQWHDTRDDHVRWSQRFAEDFVVYVALDTTQGPRYMRYRPVNGDMGVDGNYIDFGLGAGMDDGQWHTFERNLQQDVSAFEPGNLVLAINAFLVRGSGRLDDIQTFHLNRIFAAGFE
ncbi:hypothetical protein [Thiolapillus brandeum]|nr:hypothetical protein [Thiolapillus brandeum]